MTAGNASGVNDGAAAIVVMSESQARERGLTPLGVVESYASVGVDPKIMGIGPVPAVRKLFARTGRHLTVVTPTRKAAQASARMVPPACE